jgi:hypothetical protein
MRITIHQPEHMPWSGFFHKMAMADLYVVLDHVQFEKNYYQNRNRFIDARGIIFWATVPVQMSSSRESISSKRIAHDFWKRKYLNKLLHSYSRTPYFDAYFESLRSIILFEHDLLVDLNLELINWFRLNLNIRTPMRRSSEMIVSGAKSDMILDICKQLSASEYLSGPSGRDYLKPETFAAANIDIKFHEFTPPVYPAANYNPGLSMLDVLMNCGPQSGRLLGLP